MGGGSSSLIESSLGLPSYQESFAVDPNEVLSKNVQPKKEDLGAMEENPLDFLFNADPVRCDHKNIFKNSVFTAFRRECR